MAYSRIEQAYVDQLVQVQFPDPVESEDTLLASANTGVATDAPSGIRVGRAGVPFKGPSMSDITEPAMGMLDMGAATVKGAAQGFIGFPGDLEGLGRLALNYMGVNVDEATALPTTAEVKKFFDEKLGVVGTGKNPYEGVGEIVAPGGQLKAVKPVAKALKGAVKMTEGLPVGLSTKAVGQGVDDLGFYSAASQAVDAIQQPKGTGEQFLAQISKTPGVKPDEIKWTGLDDFLKSKKTVTKQEVQDYMASNRVEIKEVRLGETSDSEKTAKLNEVLTPYGYSFKESPITGTGYFDPNGKQVTYTALPSDARKDLYKAEREINDPKKIAKYEKYQMPGGENYREILLTLPSKENAKPTGSVVKDGKDAEYPWAIMVDGNEVNRVDSLEFADEILQDEIRRIAGRVDKKAEFQSTHFNQPNILAHLRVNDRVDADGKKVLMVEEVQSDWHQAGRKKGYKGDINEAAKEYTSILKEWGNKTSAETPPEVRARLNELRPIVSKNATEAVPDAPFKGNWHELAMKRAIQMAAEGGYERIAFTTGKTQAARFDLSKQVDRITSVKEGDGFRIFALDTNGKNNDMGVIPKNDLPDVVGKDLADKISKQSKDTDIYEGIDLQVGGEGMAGFYDNILPKFLDKYAKKWDAKTGMTDIITQKASDNYPSNIRRLEGGSVKKGIDKSEPVHYIDITPKMRESVVTKGQPMFSIGAGGAGVGAAATQQDQEN